jgi:hypothetical protein
MKRALSVLLALILTISVLTLFSSAERGFVYTAPKGTPVIDGVIDDIWQYAEWTSVEYPHDGSDKAEIPELLRIKLLWDETHLYFLAEVTDADLNYENDLVEIYIDEGNERGDAYDDNDGQTRFRWDGTVIQDSGTNCQNDAPGAGTMTDTGWITEGAIKWSDNPVEGRKSGLEFMFNVGGSDADFTAALRWNVDTAGGDPAPYQSPAAFGTLVLGAAPVIETEPPETEAPADEPVVDAPVAVPAAQTSDILLSVTTAAFLAVGIIFAAEKKIKNKQR